MVAVSWTLESRDAGMYDVRVLVAPWIYNVVVYGGLGVALGGVVWVIVRKERARRAKEVPAAGVVARRSALQIASRYAPVLLILGGLWLSAFTWWYRADVAIVRPGPSGPEVTRYKWIGRGTPYPAARPSEYPCARRDTWIVNEARRELTVQHIGYGATESSSLAQPLRPGDIACVLSLDYIGPDDVPPSEITVSQSAEVHAAGVQASARRAWLSWKP